MTAPKEHGILYMPEMVRAYLAGLKRQTRRHLYTLGQVRGTPKRLAGWEPPYPAPAGQQWNLSHWANAKAGEILWGRETTCTHGGTVSYFADGDWIAEYALLDPEMYARDKAIGVHPRWRPSIHMPRELARIVTPLVSVRIERLQDISEEDARAEGIADGGCVNCGNPEPCGCAAPSPSAIDAYCHLWSKINGDSDWHANPPVVVLEFEGFKP